MFLISTFHNSFETNILTQHTSVLIIGSLLGIHQYHVIGFSAPDTFTVLNLTLKVS